MRAALCDFDIPVVVYGEEDVGSFRKIGQRFSESVRIRRVLQHEGHGGTEEHDLCIRELG